MGWAWEGLLGNQNESDALSEVASVPLLRVLHFCNCKAGVFYGIILCHFYFLSDISHDSVQSPGMHVPPDCKAQNAAAAAAAAAYLGTCEVSLSVNVGKTATVLARLPLQSADGVPA